jgi:glucosamine--fructose-6-phosphate aminotransferase (isomerizing)
MCGIFGAVLQEPVSDALIEGLKRLEYRGYDSAGIATLETNGLSRTCAVGKVARLEACVDDTRHRGRVGIAHTRWATHGQPSDRNAHPHIAADVAVVHNGIVENYRELRSELSAGGCKFRSETDTEVIPWLISRELDLGSEPARAVEMASARLEGSYAVAAMIERAPDMLFALRRGSPLAIGFGPDGAYVASDPLALAGYATQALVLEDGDSAVVRHDTAEIRDATGRRAHRRLIEVATRELGVDKGKYSHFMLKEIHEQPAVAGLILRNYAHSGAIAEALDFDFARVNRIRLVACGSSRYAAMLAKRWFEEYAALPCEVAIASEYRYDPLPPAVRGEMAILISQSGETADTIAALERLRERRIPTLGLVNQEASTLARKADFHLPLLAGPEIGVASTKAFLAQLVVAARLALFAAEVRGTSKNCERLAEALSTLPELIAATLHNEPAAMAVAGQLAGARNALFIGRGPLYPVAMEGALKLKEISYIHAEGFAAGELKHGPIALVEADTPIVALATSGDLFAKTVSNIREVTARGGKLIVLGDRQALLNMSDIPHDALTIPRCDPLLQPIIASVPLQLLAYHVALLRGADVDKPRNLAKSVTVE